MKKLSRQPKDTLIDYMDTECYDAAAGEEPIHTYCDTVAWMLKTYETEENIANATEEIKILKQAT